uniref:Nuclear receptor domain-containing protein n=1 Tax=Mesocestoides corti TaxID=53468 RepID=A0A5K3FL62_MESCO
MQPELTTPILLSLNFHADTVRTSVMSATFQENPSEKENQESKGAELTEANSDQSKVSQDLSKQTGPTHVTIQLPESMQGTSISQQKMQELIAHLSQSGQLNDDGKIIIQVKGSLEKPEERSQSSEKNSDADQEHQMPPPQPVSSAPSIKPSPHQVSSHAIRYVTVQQAPSSSVFSTSTPKTAVRFSKCSSRCNSPLTLLSRDSSCFVFSFASSSSEQRLDHPRSKLMYFRANQTPHRVKVTSRPKVLPRPIRFCLPTAAAAAADSSCSRQATHS